MIVDAIRNGIVIDHITAGHAMELYSILELDKLDCTVAVLKNVPSKKKGKKDIIKVDTLLDVDLDVLGYIDYGTLGVLIVPVFYFAKSPLRLILGAVLIVLMALKKVLFDGFSFENIYQIFALISLILLFIYNNKKGKLNLKYFFYVFYPAHLIVLWVITLLI